VLRRPRLPVVRLGLARVHGRSMEPTLVAGDRLLVAHGVRPRTGGLVVVRLPDGTVAVKRATSHGPDGWWVERDNPAMGVDSWTVGAIPDHDVVARVLVRLPRKAVGD
jgi:phage repressor protein C with HTH and peptisase S24 domain